MFLRVSSSAIRECSPLQFLLLLGFCRSQIKSFIYLTEVACSEPVKLGRFLSLTFGEGKDLEPSARTYLTAMFVRIAEPYPCAVEFTLQGCIEFLRKEKTFEALLRTMRSNNSDANTKNDRWNKKNASDTSRRRWNLIECLGVPWGSKARSCDKYKNIPGNGSELLLDLRRFHLINSLNMYGAYDPQMKFESWIEPLKTAKGPNIKEDLFRLAAMAFKHSKKAKKMIEEYGLKPVIVLEPPEYSEKRCSQLYFSLTKDLIEQPISGSVSSDFLNNCSMSCGPKCSTVRFFKKDPSGSSKLGAQKGHTLPGWLLGECATSLSQRCKQDIEFLTSEVRREIGKACFEDTSVALPTHDCL